MNDFWYSEAVAPAWSCFVVPLNAEFYLISTYLTENAAFIWRTSWLKLYREINTVLRIISNVSQYCVSKMQSFLMLQQVLHVLTTEFWWLGDCGGHEWWCWTFWELGSLGRGHCVVTWILTMEMVRMFWIWKLHLKTEYVHINTEPQEKPEILNNILSSTTSVILKPNASYRVRPGDISPGLRKHDHMYTSSLTTSKGIHCV